MPDVGVPWLQVGRSGIWHKACVRVYTNNPMVLLTHGITSQATINLLEILMSETREPVVMHVAPWRRDALKTEAPAHWRALTEAGLWRKIRKHVRDWERLGVEQGGPDDVEILNPVVPLLEEAIVTIRRAADQFEGPGATNYKLKYEEKAEHLEHRLAEVKYHA